jgi:hypothetical protein
VSTKAVISVTTGLEDPEKVTVAFLVAVGVAESGRPTLMFLTKEAVRLAVDSLIEGAEIQGTIPLWQWIGDEGATTPSAPEPQRSAEIRRTDPPARLLRLCHAWCSRSTPERDTSGMVRLRGGR